jgi:hypothetical protein
MKVISETIKPTIEQWDDPGDYPSGAGSSPLPSYNYVESVDGEVTIEFDDIDLSNLLNEVYDPELPHEIVVTKWNITKIEGRKITFEVAEFEGGDIKYDGPEYDPGDDE